MKKNTFLIQELNPCNPGIYATSLPSQKPGIFPVWNCKKKRRICCSKTL